MVTVSAAILTAKKEEAKKLIKKFKQVDYIQFDVIDNKFVQGKTLWADDIAKLKVKQPIELHLMIDKPEKHLSEFLKCKPKRVIFHIEATKKANLIIKRLRKEGIKSGIAINPETKIDKIKKYLHLVDFILVMTVHPGRQNQKFLHSMLGKIRQIRDISMINIGVDGGINKKTAKLAVNAGATTIASGSFLAKSSQLNSLISYFKKI